MKFDVKTIKIAGYILLAMLATTSAGAWGIKEFVEGASGAVSDPVGFVEDIGTEINNGVKGLNGAISTATKIDANDFSFDAKSGVLKFDGEVGLSMRIGGANTEIKVPLKFQYDMKNNMASADSVNIDLEYQGQKVGTLNLNVAKLKAVTDMDFTKAVELIPNFGIVKREIESNYAAVKAGYESKYGRDNVYFASQNFVRWCCAETAGKWVAGAFVPALANSNMKDAQKRAKEETAEVVKWLKGKSSVADPKNVATDLLSGNSVSIPEITLKWNAVKYQSRIKVGNQVITSNFLPNNHGAFVFIWRNGSPASDIPDIDGGSNMAAEVANLAPLPKWTFGALLAYGDGVARVVSIDQGTPAAASGVSVGEFIESVDGNPVGKIDGVTVYFSSQANRSADGRVSLGVKRLQGGQWSSRTVNVTLAPSY